MYLGGSPYESNIVYLKDEKEEKGSYKFLHKDYLGTILAISDQTGKSVESRHFDAWGNLTHGEMKILDRGYTSHEHLFDVGIIHMNGRLYDPLLRRFLNADENIQDPYNTQNYNKYGYVMNNPLMFNDPSGEIIPFVIAAAVIAAKAAILAVVSYTVNLLVNADMNKWSLQGASKAALIGAISGVATFGIGTLFKSAASALLSERIGSAIVQALAHGAVQGITSVVQGGDFMQGAAAGTLASLGASAWGLGMESMGFGETAKSALGTIGFGALSGGVGAELSGGNFWKGAVIGGTVAGFNHVMHGGQGHPKPKKVIHNTLEATLHYYFGGGEDAKLSKGTQHKLHKTHEYQRVINRLITGIADNLSGSFSADMEKQIFHVGRTNVDYVTTCTTGECTTVFTDFVRDGFWDPDFVKERTLGLLFDNFKPDGMGPNLEDIVGNPYRYIPRHFQITYKNPGYPIIR